MGECLADHATCSKDGDNILGGGADGPTRLLDTGSLDGEPVLRLVDHPDGDRVKYCALSYCWGNEEEENFATTRDMYQDRREGIVLVEMPKTFRDAVIIARRVGCRYIWVRSYMAPLSTLCERC